MVCGCTWAHSTGALAHPPSLLHCSSLERFAHLAAAVRSGSCGYPRILHGGMTAAVLDEAFGFLFLSLRHHGQLPFVAPAFTAHLEVAYRKVRRSLVSALA